VLAHRLAFKGNGSILEHLSLKDSN